MNATHVGTAGRGDLTRTAGTRAGTMLRAAAWAGIVGPLLFTTGFLAQESVRRGEFNPVAEPVSALAAGPGGWAQNVNFVVFGILTIVFAIGLDRGLHRTRRGVTGPALIAASGVGLLLAAAIPLRADAAGGIYDPGGHVIAGMLFFGGSAGGLTVLAGRLRQDPAWRGLAGFTRLCGVTAVVAFLVGGGLVMRDGAPLNAWAGLYQRAVLLALLFPCRFVLAVRLLRVSRSQRVP